MLLEDVHCSPKWFRDYRTIIEENLYQEILTLSQDLKGAKVLHLNATAYGGGVAEILQNLIPLTNDLGLKTSWKVLKPDVNFFIVTKKIHNALQGTDRDLTKEEWRIYENFSKKLAREIDHNYDFIIIHDPQPAALLHYIKENTTKVKWIWRCHIDTSLRNPETANYFMKFLKNYDACIYSLKNFIFTKSIVKNVKIIPPVIDPLSEKNISLSKDEIKRILKNFGIEGDNLIAQVSRFDRAKDPLGVMMAFIVAKQKIPDLKLALVGSMAADDPESYNVFQEASTLASEMKDVFIFRDLSDFDINAFQAGSKIILQKSIREGFGLTVSEALWKGTPVIGGNAGGIPLQIIDGKSGYLVSNIEECSQKIISLLRREETRKKMGEIGREHVRKNFLLPRLLRDELKLFLELKS